jgi:hypothetical protein
MANKQRAFVEVQLDKKRHFRFTMNALEIIEDELGFGLHEMEGKNLKMKEIKLIMWAGLLHEDPDLTLEQLGNMIDTENMKYVQEQMGKAFEQSQAKN